MISAQTEFMVLPYSSVKGQSLLERLTRELMSDRWTSFWCGVAFANRSGNEDSLLKALVSFAERGGSISMTFGADVFGADSYGTELAAVHKLLSVLEKQPKARLFLYHEHGRTFHPKMYVFSGDGRALVIIGSSNWTKGGLSENVEANVAVHLDLSDSGHKAAFDELIAIFEEYWSEAE